MRAQEPDEHRGAQQHDEQREPAAEDDEVTASVPPPGRHRLRQRGPPATRSSPTAAGGLDQHDVAGAWPRRAAAAPRRPHRAPTPSPSPSRRRPIPAGSALHRPRPSRARDTPRRAASLPIPTCSVTLDAPSSRISPSTAQRPRGRRRGRPSRRGPAARRATDSGLALYASSTTVTPARSRSTDIRPRADRHGVREGRRRPRPSGRPSASATVAAASAWLTWCRRAAAATRGADRSPCVQDEARARGPVDPHVRRRVRRRGGAEREVPAALVRAAIAATSGSSAFSTATPPPPRSAAPRRARPWPGRSPSSEPNSPTCAEPTLSTTPTRRRDLGQPADVAGPARPQLEHQVTRALVAAAAPSAGSPISLLYDPVAATVGPSGPGPGRAGPWCSSCRPSR